MNLKTKLLDLLERAYQEEQAFVEKLSDEERTAIGTLEQWSAKDMMAHNATWKERMAQSLAAAARDEPLPAVDDINQVNAKIFEEHRDDSWTDVLGQSERAYRLLVERIQATRNEDLLDTDVLPWQNGRPLWRPLVGNGYSHPISHLAQYYTDRGDTSYAIQIQEEVADSLAQLDDSPAWQGVVRYNLACQYALAGQKDRAITRLREALRLNPDLTEWSKQDPDFTSIREDPDYNSLYAG
jgi:tetratricopeptide (TPR) repeat protein